MRHREVFAILLPLTVSVGLYFIGALYRLTKTLVRGPEEEKGAGLLGHSAHSRVRQILSALGIAGTYAVSAYLSSKGLIGKDTAIFVSVMITAIVFAHFTFFDVPLLPIPMSDTPLLSVWRPSLVGIGTSGAGC